MALAVKPATKKIFAYVLGALIAVVGLFYGSNIVLTRAVDEEPQAVTVTEITATGASIEWETGQEVQGAVRYGKGQNESDLTLIAPELEPSKKHKVDLTLLESGTTYYFTIVGGTETEFDNKGVPWTFTTTSEDGSIPTSYGSPNRNVTPIQRLVIEDESNEATINCQTETNCALIKANFDKGCSTSDYVKCTYRNSSN